MRNRINIFLFAAAALLLAACDDSFHFDKAGGDGTPVTLTIPFGSHDNLDIRVDTRATLPAAAEKKIYNMYIFIFDAGGKKIYGELFDSNNLNATDRDNYWTTDDGSGFSAGKLHIKTISRSGCTIYGITNVNADMVNISPEKLDMLQTEADMKALVATMNQEIVARSGYFPMSGYLTGVNTASLSGTLELHRLDAKVIFNVNIGEPDAGNQRVKEFQPLTWQVVNVPKGAYVINRDADASNGFFDTQAVNFEETSQDGTNSFSFYMLENRYTTPSTVATSEAIGSQANRSKQRKIINEDGSHTNGAWYYAGENSTYVVINGRVIMDDPVGTTDGSTDAEGRILDADVRYVVHLGDFSGSKWNDFNVKRNTAYTYNVTIKGVDDIRVEVETRENDFPVENAPGATGDVTIATEEIFRCDAHYDSRVMSIHKENITQNLSWYVRTPFCDGQPVVVNGVDIPDGLDYEWVGFMLNEKEENSDGTLGDYKTTRREFHPDSLMNIMELVRLLKTQQRLAANNRDNIFDSEDKISFTAFVNEFYYETHPITKSSVNGLWRLFVNQPMREMHILADPHISKDTESTTINSAVTIQQKSIQTIYNTNNEQLASAWGLEHEDEYKEKWAYESTEYTGITNEDRGNSDLYNGRLNSCKEWGLAAADGTTFVAGPLWSDYMNTVVDNDTPLLNAEHSNMRYNCLSRNRDNNGNGKIDEDEVRWYTASIRQLVGIFMGQDGVDNDAKLYTKTGQESGYNWHQMVVSSTMGNDDYHSNSPYVVWAEEGVSTSSFRDSRRWIFGSTNGVENYEHIYSVRCVRNLGKDDAGVDFSNSTIDKVPTDYCVVTGSADDGYLLDFKYLNDKSIRYYSSRELDCADEKSMQNRLYRKFETAPKASAVTGLSYTFESANNTLNSNITANPYCPEGYRLPNQRELAIISYYTTGLITHTLLTRTYCSLGNYSMAIDDGSLQKIGQPGYGANSATGNVTLDPYYAIATVARCVRDVQ